MSKRMSKAELKALSLSNSEIGLAHTLPKEKRFVPETTIGRERGRSRFKEYGSFYVDNKPSGSDDPGIATRTAHSKRYFGEPPVSKFDDTRTRTWAGHNVDRNLGMPVRTSQFTKQVYAQESRRRAHNEDQAHLLRHFRMKRMTRQEMMRKRPLKNKRAIGDEKKRREFYNRARLSLKSAPADSHGRRHQRMIAENIHERFSWNKAFSPSSQDLERPELNPEHLASVLKPNPRRGKAVGFWNKKYLNLGLRSPDYTAYGSIE